MSVHEGHRERMRERIINNGLQSLQDHEVLEWLLFHSVPRSDVNALAHRLIKEFGSLHGVLEAGYDALLTVPKVGKATALFLSSFLEVYNRYNQSKQKQNVRSFRDMEDISNYVRVCFVSEPEENLHALLLDKDMHLIRDEIISHGIFSQVPLNMRSLTMHCLNSKASYVVLCHNHPSNILFPSSHDVHLTAEVATVLHRLNIELLDHIIVGTDGVLSMKNSNEYAYLFF